MGGLDLVIGKACQWTCEEAMMDMVFARLYRRKAERLDCCDFDISVACGIAISESMQITFVWNYEGVVVCSPATAFIPLVCLCDASQVQDADNSISRQLR